MKNNPMSNNESVKRCKLCSSGNLIEMINFGDMPIAHKLLTRKEKKEDYYPLIVHYCKSCGLGQIYEPIKSEVLYKNYNYCISLWKPQPHMQEQIETLLAYSKKGPVIEIGSNDGMFLEKLKEKGFLALSGIEPNIFVSNIARKKGFHIYSDMLSEDVCKKANKFGKFETVIARQTLEHLVDIKKFFRCIDELIKDNGLLLIDVPYIETNLAIGDCSFIWEEHVNYFSEPVIKNIVKRFNYSPISIKRYNFSGGIIEILAEKTKKQLKQEDIPKNFEKNIINFKKRVNEFEETLKKTLIKKREEGFGIILYGVGCRACTVVNGLRLGGYIDFAIDDQKERQNKYMPGSRLYINNPSVLNSFSKPLIFLLAVNQENETIVKEKLAKTLKNQIKFASLLGPNNIMLEIKGLERIVND